MIAPQGGLFYFSFADTLRAKMGLIAQSPVLSIEKFRTGHSDVVASVEEYIWIL